MMEPAPAPPGPLGTGRRKPTGAGRLRQGVYEGVGMAAETRIRGQTGKARSEGQVRVWLMMAGGDRDSEGP